jgi:hypothetical protein
MASPQSSSRRLTVTMGIKAHPPATLSPVSPASEANPPTIAPYATWARTVAIGVPRRSCASRILGLEQPPAVGGAERAAPRPRTEGPDEIRRIQAQAT